MHRDWIKILCVTAGGLGIAGCGRAAGPAAPSPSSPGASSATRQELTIRVADMGKQLKLM